MNKFIHRIEKKQYSIKIIGEKNQKEYSLQKLDNDFIDWQRGERKQLMELLKKDKNPVFLSPHLPTLITFDLNNPDFPVNTVCKGVGLVPIEEKLVEITQEINQIVKKIKNQDFKKTLSLRLEAANIFYDKPEIIDGYALGGLEIFESKSFENIQKNPRVTLFFVGNSPTYKSYQLNCIAEIISPDHPFYNFIINMRSLFEEARFHFQQPVYPFAIRYHIVHILDKSLKVRPTK